MSELINNQHFKKQEALKVLIKRLHQGEDPDVVKEAFLEQFSDVSTTEISSMEQALISDGMAVEEIQKLCDVHAAVFGGNISDIHKGNQFNETLGHPIQVLSEENRKIETLIEEELLPYLDQKGNMSLLMLRVGLDRLSEIDRHYARKEQLFFPYLEKKGISGPPQVMWGVDDEIRKDLKAIKQTLDQPHTNVTEVAEPIRTLVQKVKDMIFKEDNILIPLLSDTLNLYHFIKIDEASDEIGYFIEAPKQRWNTQSERQEVETINQNGLVNFDTGSLQIEELNALLNALPFDITFVDKEGFVKYFSQGKERIFERPKTVLGRHVNMCHPPASVHVVEKIIEQFKSGLKNHEDFWIRFKGVFVHIRYFAVRNQEGDYLGTLEVTQNIAPIQDLSGEKRLMDDNA